MLADNYDRWMQHEARLQRELAMLPVCACCSEPIQDDFCYKIDGEILCEECLNEEYRKQTSDFIREM